MKPQLARPESDFWCKDCRVRQFCSFMVHDELWVAAGCHPRDILCRSCFETRLGRALSWDDFTLCGLNLDHVQGFATEARYRKLYAESGLDYDRSKAEYLERCARLGVEPSWTIISDTKETG